MRLSKEERDRREAEKQERKFNRTTARFKKLVKGADVLFDENGYTVFTYADGSVFKCRGPLPEAVFGHAPEGVK